MKTISISIDKDEANESIKNFDEIIGRNFYIQTVTYHHTAKVVGILAGKFLILENAAWIAETARFMSFIQNGEENETEPYGAVGNSYLSIDTIVLMIPWIHKLPDQQK